MLIWIQQRFKHIIQNFLNYEGTQSGTQVRALLDTVRSHNLAHTDDPSLNVTVMTSTAAGVTAAPTAVVTATDVNNVKKNYKMQEKTYTVDFGYDANSGFIVAVGIVAK